MPLLAAIGAAAWGWKQTLQLVLILLVVGALVIGVIVAVGLWASKATGIGTVIGPVVGLVGCALGYAGYRSGR